eukprot:2526079-Pleurochrysis_carterae.AAC.1
MEVGIHVYTHHSGALHCRQAICHLRNETNSCKHLSNRADRVNAFVEAPCEPQTGQLTVTLEPSAACV